MHIPINAIRIAQRHLRQAGHDPGPVDGDLGPRTEAALDSALAERRDELSPEHAEAILGRSRRRKITAWIQLLAHDADIDAGPVDGWWGPQTDYAFDVLEYFDAFGVMPHPWRDFDGPPQNPHGWPPETGGALRDFYGAPGDHQVTVDAPYPLRLAWDLGTSVRRITCHRRVADSMRRVLGGVLEHYGLEAIRDLHLDHFGGCFNLRRKRGGTAWSTHAWGIALDFDTDRNRLHWGRQRAAFARPEYLPWWELWEEEGWVSLGRVANFDWMHVQAALRPR